MTLYGDGWYTTREAAADIASFMEKQGAKVVGLVVSSDDPYAGWGVLYWSESCLFDNHDFNRIDPTHPFKAVLFDS